MSTHLSYYTFVIHLQPLPDTEVLLYESRLVQQQKRKHTTNNEGLVQADQGQTSFKVCRKYVVSFETG